MWLTGGVILLIRLMTLAMRFALTVYITASLGLVAMGQFGIVLGLAALAPALVGMGLNFHLCRDVVSNDPLEKIALVRDRMRWTAAVLALAALVGVPAWWMLFGPPNLTVILVITILCCEALAMDAYLALTGLKENVIANIGVALRSAAWVPVVIVLGWAMPEMRTLNAVFAGWLGGHLANFVFMGAFMARRGYTRRWREDVKTGWVAQSMRGGLQVWPSDIALVLITFGDRFILSATVGDEALGTYVFYWTFANMVQTLIQSAIVTPALPRLIGLYRSDRSGWLVRAQRLGILIPSLGLAMSTGALLVIWAGYRFVPESNFPWRPDVGVLIFAAVVARFLGDFLSTVLNSAGAMKDYALLNIGFAGTLMIAIALGAMAGGIAGAAIASLVTALVFNTLKISAILRLRRPVVA